MTSIQLSMWLICSQTATAGCKWRFGLKIGVLVTDSISIHNRLNYSEFGWDLNSSVEILEAAPCLLIAQGLDGRVSWSQGGRKSTTTVMHMFFLFIYANATSFLLLQNFFPFLCICRQRTVLILKLDPKWGSLFLTSCGSIIGKGVSTIK